LGGLGLCYADLGEIPRAIALHEEALGIAREIGDRWGEADCVGGLCLCYDDLGEIPQAIRHHQHALESGRMIFGQE
jgi:tetratricopeptide (TPR) repeat protein